MCKGPGAGEQLRYQREIEVIGVAGGGDEGREVIGTGPCRAWCCGEDFGFYST